MTEKQKQWEWVKRWMHVYMMPNGPAWVHPKIVEKMKRIINEKCEPQMCGIEKMCGT